MNTISLTPTEAKALTLLAAFGLIVPHGGFLYFFLADSGATRAALTNPISLVFILEAFFLMVLFAWLLAKAGTKKPTAAGFVILSLLGSLACSVPLSLWFLLRDKK